MRGCDKEVEILLKLTYAPVAILASCGSP